MIFCLNRTETDPYFNLAAEEYLLKEFTQDVFSVWQNEQSIIIGKHQNASREIDHELVAGKKIPVIRRITGGGTVFHDPGNINYSFIATGEKEKLVDFRKFTAPVIGFLGHLGVEASFSGKNNIVIDGLKVSGNSAHVFKNRILHHGTLLFSSNLALLNRAIAGREQLYNDKSVRSIRSRVANVKDYLKTGLDVITFKNSLFNFIAGTLPGCISYQFTDQDISRINALKSDRYLADEWNLGYSPFYAYRNHFPYREKTVFVKLSVKKGIIEESKITLEGFPPEAADLLNGKILGKAHKKETIRDVVSDITFAKYFTADFLNQLVKNMF